ncbi:MAG: hypothetical protein U0441_34690 [Polyangiaceae bacterium]
MRSLILGATALVLAACTGTTPEPATPHGPSKALAPMFIAAMEAEQKRSDDPGPYLDMIDEATRDPANPEALGATAAALDALVFGATPELEVGGESAIVYRSPDAMKTVIARLEAAWATAGKSAPEGTKAPAALPFVRALLSRALHHLALYTGEEGAATAWIARRGCAMQASVMGPLEWSALKSLDGPSPIGATDPFPAKLPGVAPFAAQVEPVIADADACGLDTKGQNYLQGSRVLVVDVQSPKAQRIAVMLDSGSAATVEIGGVPVLRRLFEAGGGTNTRFGAVDVPEGWTRVVVRLARRGDGARIELNLFGDRGERLPIRAPQPGDVATGKGTNPEAIEIRPVSASDSSVVLAASGLLGIGEARAAEHLVEPKTVAADAKSAVSHRPPALELVYTRAMLMAGEVPYTKMSVRLRDAVDHIQAEWKDAWEPKLLHARLAERRKGWGDGAVEALTDLGVVVASPGEPAHVPSAEEADRLVLATIAMVAKRSRLSDVAEAAYAELAKKAQGSALLLGADSRLHGRSGPDAIRAACESGVDRAGLSCFYALQDQPNNARTLAELDRVRRLRSAPNSLRDTEIYQRIRMGDRHGALVLYDALPPAERGMLDVLGYHAQFMDTDSSAKDRFQRDRLVARDTPWAIGPLSRALNIQPDPAPALEAAGKKLVEADRQNAFLPGAGTAVLDHTETYDIEPTGFVHYVVYDLRRVSGTTDVAYGAYTYGPIIEGRTASRQLRRRIHKHDGRILEPDAAPFASQGGSDLSQLEQNDYVEEITEGWSLPNDMGQLTIDTPDLLPERTSVKSATITLRYPASLAASMWAHPLLGAAAEKKTASTIERVYRITDAKPRRIEDGVPPLERSVALSFGTQSWSNIGRALEEQIRSLEETDPFVDRWIDEAAGDDKKPSRALVERVVAAVGKKLKISGGGELSDAAALYSDGAQRGTARGMIETKQGSRTWLVYRALKRLGVPADIAISETEPYTTAKDFPVHAGRFRHPLVVAHLGGTDGDVWIDADVDGPPLPPGRISPELRGRTAMLPGGKLVTVEGTATDTVDEVDVRLTVNDKGDATGSFTILLHGRPAQALSDAFETVVGTERREILRSVVLGWLPWADVDDVALSSSEGSWEIALRATIKINGFGRPEGKDGKVWVLGGLEPVHMAGRGGVGTLGATYASRAARQDALSIDSPIQYHVRRRIDLPAGVSVVREPATIDVRDPHLTASRKGTYKGTVIEEDYRLNLPTGTVDAGEYQQFVERVHVVDDGFMAGIRVKK